jgi:hypothetical protein
MLAFHAVDVPVLWAFNVKVPGVPKVMVAGPLFSRVKSGSTIVIGGAVPGSPGAWLPMSPSLRFRRKLAVFVNERPLTLVAVSSSTTSISMTTCSPAGMSIPTAGSSITRLVAVPVLTGVQASLPEILLTLRKRRSAAEAVRSSVIWTS